MSEIGIDQKYATEYHLGYRWPDEDKPRNVLITRHNNHGGWIDDKGWVVCLMLSPMNPWYLSDDGLWRYKYGHRWATADLAHQMLRQSRSLTASVDKLDPTTP